MATTPNIEAMRKAIAALTTKAKANGLTLKQMKDEIAKHYAIKKMADGGAVDIATVGINEAPDMDVKEAVMPNATAENAMPTGGVDFQPQAPGMQLAQQAPAPQPGQAPGAPGQPQGMPQVGQSVGMPGQGMPTMPAPQGASPVAAGAPPSNILSRTPQGNMLQAMKPMARMKDGGSTSNHKEKFLSDSKIRKVLYHGTTADIKSFDPTKHGQKDHGWYGHGHYLTADPETASAYANYDDVKDYIKNNKSSSGANVLPVHVKVKNPYHWPEDRQPVKTKEESLALTKELIGKGHDSVIVSNKYQHPDYAAHHEVVVFDPKMIKSAIGNRGTYDTSKADITMKTGGKVKGVIKEKVKVTPTGDAMMYELTRAQRYTKKVK